MVSDPFDAKLSTVVTADDRRERLMDALNLAGRDNKWHAADLSHAQVLQTIDTDPRLRACHYCMRPLRTPEERFWSKVDKTETCWLWTAFKDKDGYGRFDRNVKSHRFAYEMILGPIPEGLELDHLCRNPPCVNPAHLEPVTHRENVLRGTSPAAFYAAQTHCKEGHLFDAKNTRITPDGGRCCRKCHADSSRRHYAKWGNGRVRQEVPS